MSASPRPWRPAAAAASGRSRANAATGSGPARSAGADAGKLDSVECLEVTVVAGS